MASDNKWLAALSQAHIAEVILKVVWIQKVITVEAK
jgi:hypothetical protein